MFKNGSLIRCTHSANENFTVGKSYRVIINEYLRVFVKDNRGESFTLSLGNFTGSGHLHFTLVSEIPVHEVTEEELEGYIKRILQLENRLQKIKDLT